MGKSKKRKRKRKRKLERLKNRSFRALLSYKPLSYEKSKRVVQIAKYFTTMNYEFKTLKSLKQESEIECCLHMLKYASIRSA